jgi:non-ribosomal peptide synthetase component E (peptide arylation enzyme)
MDSLFPCLFAATGKLALRADRGRELTQAELAAACAGHVAALARRGIGPGERVGVWTQPALETMVALVAHAAAGYVSVPIDPKLGDRELAHVLGDAKPRICVAADPSSAGVAARAETMVAGIATGPALAPRPIDGSPALVLYTSGTTGAPKGAVITDRNIASDLDMLAEAWAWTADDTVVHALPLFHVHGLVLGLFGAIRRGGALRWVAKFTPEELAKALGKEASAMLFAVPTMYHRLCEAAEATPAIGAALRLGPTPGQWLGAVARPRPPADRGARRAEARDRALRPDRDVDHRLDGPARRRSPRQGFVGLAARGAWRLRLVDDASASRSRPPTTRGDRRARGARRERCSSAYLDPRRGHARCRDGGRGLVLHGRSRDPRARRSRCGSSAAARRT